MFDYRAIEALYMVQEMQNFELAAKKLHVTQSAISQRIRSLEDYYGEPVLIRTQPYRPTLLGKKLIGHFKKVALLEKELKQQLGAQTDLPTVSIALNRDSLETWFMNLIEESDIFKGLLLEIIADDQELTLNYLKNGTVSACLSTSEKEVLGGNVSFLGSMEYILVASPSFAKQYFSKNNLKKCLQNAPAIKFDQNDKLHERYLEKFFGINGSELKYSIIPSVKGFKQFTLMGHGYALIPKMDIVEELKKKLLVKICPKSWNIPLYWHYWAIQSKFYQKFNADMILYAKQKLTTDVS
jgi:LysR family transcriptional regulator (chromosome initiation inhibitor)